MPAYISIQGECQPKCISYLRTVPNKQYPQPADSQMQFDTLDSPISKIRIVLLVQIGKEGWDCRSLTGIILSQEGDCPKNMVLQTSCRCLRQVDKGQPETAMVYLNSVNGDKLIAQLQQRHHISLDEFTTGGPGKTELNRYDRTGYLKLPKVDFYQLKVSFETVTVEEAKPEEGIYGAVAKTAENIIKQTDFTLENIVQKVDDTERGVEPAVFSQWLYRLARSSFGFLSMEQLEEYTDALRAVFESIPMKMVVRGISAPSMIDRWWRPISARRSVKTEPIKPGPSAFRKQPLC